MSNPGAIVSALHATWATAFAARDADALAALYTDDAVFYGSTATLHYGRDDVRSYFTGLPARFLRATFAPWTIVTPAPDVFAASGPVTFTVMLDGEVRDLPYRMTHVPVSHGGAWLIATHHASPVP